MVRTQLTGTTVYHVSTNSHIAMVKSTKARSIAMVFCMSFFPSS